MTVPHRSIKAEEYNMSSSEATESPGVADIIEPRSRDLGEMDFSYAGRCRRYNGVASALRVSRSDGSGRFPCRPRLGRATTSARWAGDRDLSVRRRADAPGQPRQQPADPTGGGQLDDRRPRHRPLRTHTDPVARTRLEPLGHSGMGRAAAARRGITAAIYASRRTHALPQLEHAEVQLRPNRRDTLWAALSGRDLIEHVLRGCAAAARGATG